MPNEDAARLETLVEANDLFHWGTDPDAVEAAAGALDRLTLNPVLARSLEAKGARMRIVARLLSGELATAAPFLPTLPLPVAAAQPDD